MYYSWNNTLEAASQKLEFLVLMARSKVTSQPVPTLAAAMGLCAVLATLHYMLSAFLNLKCNCGWKIAAFKWWSVISGVERGKEMSAFSASFTMVTARLGRCKTSLLRWQSLFGAEQPDATEMHAVSDFADSLVETDVLMSMPWKKLYIVLLFP